MKLHIKSKFETMTQLMRSTVRRTDNTWFVMVGDAKIATIQIDRNAGGYVVFIAGIEAEPFEYRNFMKALASLIDIYRQAEIIVATRSDYAYFIANIRKRIDYFKRNHGSDPFIISMFTGNPGEKSKINYAVAKSGNSTYWAELHKEKISKDVMMFRSAEEAISAMYEIKQKVNISMIPECQIDVKRFSEALACSSEFFGWAIMDFNRKLLKIGKYNHEKATRS